MWALKPEIGILPLICVAVLPWIVRCAAGSFPFRRTSLDLPVVLFLTTAWAGYWAAYDQQTAWSKVWMIVFAVLLYYALAGQPTENLAWIAAYFCCLGTGVCLYFLLTHDFVALPRKVALVNEIGRWLTGIRPQLDWSPIHPNYVAGLGALLIPFAAYPATKLTQKTGLASLLARIFLVVGVSTVLLAIFIATSRGSIMAIASAGGLVILWWIASRTVSPLALRREVAFPALVFTCLGAITLFLYAGPAQIGDAISAPSLYGSGSRAELFTRSLYLAGDFPITGGGLGAFPGLYSHYILGLPFFYVLNSHNMFLDVSIEQGILGGMAFLSIYLLSIWSVSKAITRPAPLRDHLLGVIVFVSLIIAFVHGMVDDYLYNGTGTILSLALAGVSQVIHPAMPGSSIKVGYRTMSLAGLALILLMAASFPTLRSSWYANIGSIQLAQAELKGFPTNEWIAPASHPELDGAEESLLISLQADPANRAANHRLGLIRMLRGDFPSASAYLERAHDAAPGHRGITKSLGYSYSWSGELEAASIFLKEIPEARDELNTYVWWWDTLGRHDLSGYALEQAAYLEAAIDP